MKKIDWRYHRQNCDTCKKSQTFLDTIGAHIQDELDARKSRIGAEKALELLKKVESLAVAKGKGLLEIQLKRDRPDDETLLKLVMGPTGNLRAPTLRIGKKMLVGFNEEMYHKFLV